ncbi:MAG: KpsF/GutQ family sugar-phosphate isomerase [Betaproteobacteria bacterium]|jgi:arabinose-5-phosphate isomerase
MKPTANTSDSQIERMLKKTLEIESQELSNAVAKINITWVQAVRAILAISGRVVVMGMGKSGHIGRKIAATLASTGTPAMFVHPGEASHGDLGMILKEDIVLAISNSGESEELTSILPVLKRIGVKIIAISGNNESTLSKHADWFLHSSVEREACPLNLAPTASTTVQLAIGDALAVSLLDARGFKENDFARSHPGGSLGRKLLTLVSDIMRKNLDVPYVKVNTPFTQLMKQMSTKGLGATSVVDEEMKILGVFTDGDLRRLVERGSDLRQLTAGEVMVRNPKLIEETSLAVEAAELMEVNKITSVFVVNSQGKLVGAINSNDLMKNKVI